VKKSDFGARKKGAKREPSADHVFLLAKTKATGRGNESLGKAPRKGRNRGKAKKKRRKATAKKIRTVLTERKVPGKYSHQEGKRGLEKEGGRLGRERRHLWRPNHGGVLEGEIRPHNGLAV